MQANQLKLLVLASLEDSKAKNVETLDVRALTDVTDYMIVCSGTSNRHTRAIAENLVVKSKAEGVMPLAVEGKDTGEWILVDLIDVVVHIMLPQTREFYSLEKLWSVSKKIKEIGDKPETKVKKAAVKLKKAGVVKRKAPVRRKAANK